MDATYIVFQVAIIILLITVLLFVSDMGKTLSKLKRGSTSTEIDTKIAALYERIKSDMRLAKIDLAVNEAGHRTTLRTDLEAKIARCPHTTTLEGLRRASSRLGPDLSVFTAPLSTERHGAMPHRRGNDPMGKTYVHRRVYAGPRIHPVTTPSDAIPGAYLHQRKEDVAYALHRRQEGCPAPPPHGEGVCTPPRRIGPDVVHHLHRRAGDPPASARTGHMRFHDHEPVCTPRRPFQRDAMNRPHRRKDDPSGPGTPAYLHMRIHDHGPDCAPAHTHTRSSDANSGPEDGAHFHRRKDDSILAAPMHRRGTGRMRGPDLVPNIVPGQLRRDPEWNHHRSMDQAMYYHSRAADRGWSPGQAGGLRLNYGHIRATDSVVNGVRIHHRITDPLLEVQS